MSAPAETASFTDPALLAARRCPRRPCCQRARPCGPSPIPNCALVLGATPQLRHLVTCPRFSPQLRRAPRRASPRQRRRPARIGRDRPHADWNRSSPVANPPYPTASTHLICALIPAHRQLRNESKTRPSDDRTHPRTASAACPPLRALMSVALEAFAMRAHKLVIAHPP
ncbi:hypothetical protein WOLCODRAFT_152348 [Wolfiporia cocos MD-104 SS10]|uniref:Uncharacterized protein n=1 Tax=Wolfiporia cocos (strain MD-104) TaxID=742152 RepID=A0A2H3JJG4_WOLCO|nr:hypothetical protein WOLCODRAFT_152348 [Wolfiporia cocos MD-104 SS10]